MRSKIVVVFLAAGCHSTPAGTSVHIDITPLQRAAQTAQINVTKVGLLAVQGSPLDPAQAQVQLQSGNGATTSTTTIDPTAGDQSKFINPNDVPVTTTTTTTTNPTGDSTTTTPQVGTTISDPTHSGATRGTDTSVPLVTGAASDGTNTGTNATVAATDPGVQTIASPKAAPADAVIGSVATAGATGTEAPKFGYYPMAISPSTLTFDVAIPSGPRQTLIFLAFTTDAATGRDRPVYVGELTNIDLKGADTVQLNFDIYPAGTVRPEILPPSTLGLTDESGSPVSSVPRLNCLAVATSNQAREGFPQLTASRVVVGALASLDISQIGTGAMILPVGDWGFDCYANFAGHLFGVSPDRPMIVTVAAGQVYAPSAPLVIIKDLPLLLPGSSGGGASGSAGGISGGSSGGSGIGGAGNHPPRIIVQVGASTVSMGRGSLTGGSSGGTTGIMPAGPSNDGNIVSTSNQDVQLTVIDDNGAVDTSFTGIVRLNVLALSNQEGFPTGWEPFDPNHRSVIPHATDLSLTGGIGFFSQLLQTTTLPFDTNTHHLLLTTQALDAMGSALEPSGAMALAVRSDSLCSDFTEQTGYPASMTPFTLGLSADTVPAFVDASRNYFTPAIPLMVIALTAVNKCLAYTSDDMLVFAADATPAGVIDPQAPPFTIAGGGASLPLPGSGKGQWFYWDAVAVSATFLAQNAPTQGSNVQVTIPWTSSYLNGQLSLKAVVVAAP